MMMFVVYVSSGGSCQDMPDGLMGLEDSHDDRKGLLGYVL